MNTSYSWCGLAAGSCRLKVSFIFLVLFGGIFPAHAQRTDSLETLLKNTTGRARIDLQLRLAEAYASNNWEKSVIYATQSLDLMKDYGNDSLHFESLFVLSKSYHGLGDYEKALSFGKEASSITFDARSSAAAAHHLGRIHESRSEYQLALEHYLEAIRLHKSVDNKQGLANTMNSIAFVYKGMKQYKKAIATLEEARTIYEALGNKGRIASITFNLGLMIMEMDKPTEAIPYFRKAMEGLKEAEEPYKFSSFYNNLASCFQKMITINSVYFDSALFYGKKNLALKNRVRDLRGIANAHNVLASTYERASDHRNAYEHALRAFTLADSLQLKPVMKNALSYLITAEIGLRKMEKLNDHFLAFERVSGQLNEESNSRTLNEMAVKYETEKKEAENRQLLVANVQHTRLNWILGGGGTLLLLLLGLLSYFYRGKEKMNRELKAQKTLIASNLREKEALLREIHHRVKNNLQVISSLLNMQSYYMDDPRMVNAIAEGQNRVKAMALIHQKLYQTEQLSEIDFQEYTEQLIGHLATALSQPGKKISSTVTGAAIKLDIDTAIPLGLILNELITNAYKYAFNGVEEGSLQVDLKQDEERCYHLRITDSGKGLPENFHEGDLNSLGLKLVRMLIEQLDGSLRITNEPGASFHIRFKETRLSA